MTELANSGPLGEISCTFYAVNIILKNRGAESYKVIHLDDNRTLQINACLACHFSTKLCKTRFRVSAPIIPPCNGGSAFLLNTVGRDTA